jgi:hypothetical protein
VEFCATELDAGRSGAWRSCGLDELVARLEQRPPGE